jgi:hypothetical protein
VIKEKSIIEISPAFSDNFKIAIFSSTFRKARVPIYFATRYKYMYHKNGSFLEIFGNDPFACWLTACSSYISVGDKNKLQSK